MSGQKVAVIISYEVDEKKRLKVSRDVIFPQLRIFIESSANNWRKYRAYLRDEYSDEFLPTMVVEERTFEPGPLDSVRIIFPFQKPGVKSKKDTGPINDQQALCRSMGVEECLGFDGYR